MTSRLSMLDAPEKPSLGDRATSAPAPPAVGQVSVLMTKAGTSPPTKRTQSSPGGLIIRALVALPVLGLLFILTTTGLFPVFILVALLLLPALLPLLVVSLAVLATWEPKKVQHVKGPCEPSKPCCCGLH